MPEMTINVAKNFSRYPSGRYKTDSRFSGEEFRDDHVVPALKRHDRVVVELDGTLGYGSSFLDEAFGGIVRMKILDRDFIKSRLVLKSENIALTKEINSYLYG